ncbi:inactive receptor kinase [Musa troglodytarum]|uniref:Inactive receptor kinase n=1 Tax=Musa troglodytarum TaxID=320322 RepID=A0A9E7JBX0_9LILI|nr:inactive receptor kinase [Musa troglodytarum]
MRRSSPPGPLEMVRPLLPLLLLVFFVAIGHLGPLAVRSEPIQDRAALLAFLDAIPHKQRIRWDANSSACGWVGVTCDANRTAVVALRLPAVGLVGHIPAGTLGRLSSLRSLSLRLNRLSGPIPDDFAGLASLHSLYLQNNLFSGGIPSWLSQLTGLVRLDLSGNNLTGEIPFAVNNLTHLTGLLLQNNRLSGSLPSISIDSLVGFNVSYNRLNGSIPRTLRRFPESSFVGNLDLCGRPLPPCNPFFPSPAPSPTAEENPVKSRRKLSKTSIVGILVAAVVVLLLVLLFLICLALLRRRQRARQKAAMTAAVADEAAGRPGGTGITSSSKDDLSGGVGGSVAATMAGAAQQNRLVFMGSGGGYNFDLEDLLRASAEVLGKGSVGTSYKAVLEEGTIVVVKRLKDVAMSRREFDEHVETLGHLERIDNLLPPQAYYYSKDEKLIVLDYLPVGSLSSLLHGSRGSGRTPLGWESRMRIALAAGRGISHLHTSARIVHGNIKASNVLLRSDLHSVAVSDFGLHPLFGSAAPPNRVAGYRAPEVLETRRPTFKSDVYSFGVLLLELLTGKAPNQASLGEEGIDLPRWVQSVVREEWTSEVFDVELMRYPTTEEEMVQLLQIAMSCVATVPDARPDFPEVVRMMEDIADRTAST